VVVVPVDVPEVMPPMLVVGEVVPIGGVVPEVVFGVVPEVVLGVVPVVVLVPDGLFEEAPGSVVVVEEPGVTVGEVDGVHRPEVVEVVALLATVEDPVVLPVGLVEVLGVIDPIRQVVGLGVVCELGEAVGLTVLEGAMPPAPVVCCPALPVIEGVLLPAGDVGAEVCATAAPAKHTKVANMSAVLFMRNSPDGSEEWDGGLIRHGCSKIQPEVTLAGHSRTRCKGT